MEPVELLFKPAAMIVRGGSRKHWTIRKAFELVCRSECDGMVHRVRVGSAVSRKGSQKIRVQFKAQARPPQYPTTCHECGYDGDAADGGTDVLGCGDGPRIHADAMITALRLQYQIQTANCKPARKLQTMVLSCVWPLVRHDLRRCIAAATLPTFLSRATGTAA